MLLTLSCGSESGNQIAVGTSLTGEGVSPDVVLSRTGQITAWTDDGMFVYGGVDQTRESVGGAALIDPRTGSATSLPEPFDVPIRRVGVAAPIEGGVMLVGELCERTVYEEELAYCEPGGLVGAVMSLADRTWRSMEMPDELRAGPRSSWIVELAGVTPSGSVVLRLVTEGVRAVGDAPFWVYRPGDDEWHRLPDLGIVPDDFCLAGDQLVLVTSESSAAGGTRSNVRLHSFSVDSPRGSWLALRPLSSVDDWGAEPMVSCGGSFAVVHGYALSAGEGVAYSQAVQPPGGWAELAPMPEIVVASEVWTGQELVLFGETGGAVALIDGAWARVDVPPWPVGSDPVWTGEQIAVIDQASDVGVALTEVPE